MKERPILFSAPMVRAILEGRKTQTRRIVKPQPSWLAENNRVINVNGKCGMVESICPYGQPGDGLWVRETWAPVPMAWIDDGVEHRSDFAYRATGDVIGCHKWKPSIHMPRWASRITLEIVSVRVERLQDISEEDALAEGIKGITKDGRTIKYGIPDKDGLPGNDDNGWHWCNWMLSASAAFQELWQEINGYDSWEDNPWVWVVDFKRVQP